MDGELVNNDSPSEPIRYSTIFHREFSKYLVLGMSYDEFWNYDCTLVKDYREADKLKQKRMNERAWLQGMYVYDAICDASPILRSLAKRGTKPFPYPERPYPLSEEEANERKEKERRERYERHRAQMLGKRKK